MTPPQRRPRVPEAGAPCRRIAFSPSRQRSAVVGPRRSSRRPTRREEDDASIPSYDESSWFSTPLLAAALIEAIFPVRRLRR